MDGFIVGAVVVIGLVIYAVERMAYLKRKEAAAKAAVSVAVDKGVVKATTAIGKTIDSAAQSVQDAVKKA